jgi:hypothetical protein
LRYEFCGSQGYIECNECCTQGPCDERAADPICDLDAACDAWNRRAALAQPEPQGPTGRPAIEPVPKREDVHYAWELHDAEGEWQAGGFANSLEDVQRKGNRYLQTYAQDGPHKLIIERHCVTTIEPVPKREAEQ